jgi:hypothetical protein
MSNFGRVNRWWKGGAAALALGMAVLFSASAARADDTVHLKNGQTVTGTIVREDGGFVWIKTTVNGIEDTKLFSPGDIDKIDRDTPETDPTTDPKTDPKPDPASDPVRGADAGSAAEAPAATPPESQDEPAPSARSGATRAAIITLGEGGGKDTVGIFMTAKAIHDAIPMLERDKVDVVVFRINSGGGLLLEIQRLSDVIQNEYKPRFRTVAWIESAISAAAMTAHAIEEIYMTPEGNYGACTGFNTAGGTWNAVKGRELEEVLFQMEKISERGGHAKEIMRSMEIMEPLSCDIDADGSVHWYQNENGQYLVNPAGRILTFNSETAAKYKFSRGTAKTLDELARAMGLTEVEWVGVNKPGIAWPVSKAEAYQMAFRDKVEKDEKSLNEYWWSYQNSISVAQSQPKEKRGAWVGKARNALDKIKSMVKNNPNFALLTFGKLPSEWEEWVADREQELKDLMR